MKGLAPVVASQHREASLASRNRRNHVPGSMTRFYSARFPSAAS
jgi:hypothetical protein